MADETELRRRRQKRRTILGIVMTAVWVLFWLFATWGEFAAAVVQDKSAALTLNEWGDFFAGVFAPIAFLWLVLGYFQLGDELAHNTNALRAQERELKRQAEETANLVQQSARQAALSAEALQEERNARADQCRPDIVVEHTSSMNDRPTVRIRNAGLGSAADLLITSPDLGEPLRSSLLTNVGYIDLTFSELQANQSRFTVACVDPLQYGWEFEFSLDRAGHARRTRVQRTPHPLMASSRLMQ